MDLKELILKVVLWTGWEVAGNILTVIGAISLFVALIRFVHNSRLKKWSDNVSIRDYPYNFDVEMAEHNAIYSGIWTDEPTEYMSTIVFKPVGCVISKLKVISLNEEGQINGTIEVYKNLTPNDAVCFRIERAECIPPFKIKWYSDFGEYSEHFFSDNMRNGINSVDGTIYHATALSTIRRVLGLK